MGKEKAPRSQNLGAQVLERTISTQLISIIGELPTDSWNILFPMQMSSHVSAILH